ncbi:MAG: peptide chain release factor N(5)-glutamine methyltransferase [Gaiellaceae bacterium]
MVSLRGAVVEVERRLTAAGVPLPRVDAELLVAHAVGTSRTALYADGSRALTGPEGDHLEALLARREAREPLAYVLGAWGFRRLTLKVDRRVLVPRPETEVVVERCLARLRDHAEPEVLDVGVGSGAIALAVADEHPGARVTAFDVSPGALAVASENAHRCGLAGRVRLVEHDLTSGFGEARWHLVVSNPPYVDPDDIGNLEPEVRDWEPREALVGVGATEGVARAAFSALRPGAWLVLEVADGEAEQVAGLLETLGYADVKRTRDLTARERVVEGRRPR